MSEINFQALKVNSGNVTPDKFNAAIEIMRSLAIGKNAHVRVKRNTTGTLLYPLGGNSGSSFPFKLIKANDSDDGAQIKIIYGEVNNQAPTELTGEDTYILPVTATGYVYLIVTVDSGTGAITSISIDEAADVPDDEADVYYKSLGSFTVDTSGDVSKVSEIMQGVSGSLTFSRCRNWFVASDADNAYSAVWGGV